MGDFITGISGIIVLLIIVRLILRKQVVAEHQRGVKYEREHFVQVLEPGHYWYNPAQTKICLVDVRSNVELVSGQEILSSDGITVRISLVAIHHIADPHKVLKSLINVQVYVHTQVQIALREVVASLTCAELMDRRISITAQVRDLVGPRLSEYGLELEDVSIRDIGLTGSLKRSFSLVLEAQMEAKAALERARGEQASMRSLANTARLMDNNPNLVQLRMLQMLAESKGHTIVFSSGQQTNYPPVISAQAPHDPPEMD